jgi:hypothetical protein
MNVEIVTVAAQFLLWKYLFPIFGVGSLQCAESLAFESKRFDFVKKSKATDCFSPDSESINVETKSFDIEAKRLF